MLDRELFGTPDPEETSTTEADNNVDGLLLTPESITDVQRQDVVSAASTSSEYNPDPDSDSDSDSSDVVIEFPIPLNPHERSTRNKNPNYRT